MTASRDRAKAYQRYRIGAYLAGICISCAYLLIFQATGASAGLAVFAQSFGGGFYLSLALYFTVFSSIYALVSLPLAWYAGFVVEHRFGLSHQSIGRWCLEEVKQGALSFTFTLVLVLTLYAIGRNVSTWWWLIVSAVWLLFSIGLAIIYPVFIIPLFYRYLPLRSEELRKRVQALADRYGIRLDAVHEIDFSKNTRKSNAAVVGWGRGRRVLLADNLVNEFTPDEVSVVVAHEMAHYRLAHIRKLVFVNAVSTLLFFFLVSRILAPLAIRLGASGPFDMAVFPVVALLFGAYGLLVAPALHAFSRALEMEADHSALEVTRSPEAFISLMRRLGEKNLSDEEPSALVEYLLYTHPPIGKRIRMAERFRAQAGAGAPHAA